MDLTVYIIVYFLAAYNFSELLVRGMPVARHCKVSVEFRFHRRPKTANLIDS